MKHTAPSYLRNQFLIAMPHMDDPNFAHSLVYLIEHGPEGAMGLVVNRPNDLALSDILDQLHPNQPSPPLCQSIPVYAGGPVQTDRGFVLHPSGPRFTASVELGALSLSTSQDILDSIAAGLGPQRHLIALGYAGWDAGQLEAELAGNVWLSCPAQEHILFELPYDQRLGAAAASLGIDLNLLSTQAGHA